MTSPPVFVYDGDCRFCSASARMIVRHLIRADRAGRPRVVAWQHADLAALGLTVAECEQAVQWVASPGTPTNGGTHPAGPAAIAEVLRYGGPWWRMAGRMLRLPGVVALAWPFYRLIARHRDRLPGGTAACALPAAERAGRTAASVD